MTVDGQEVTGVNHSSLSEQVRDWILRRIGVGDFAPGDRIVENSVARELKVSAIPVREAIRELVAMHVLESAPHKGASVRQVSLEETIEALQVRSAIDSLAASLAAPKLMHQCHELRRLGKSIVAAARKHDLVAYQRANQEFHRSIVEAAGNSVLLRFWDALAYEVPARTIMGLLPSVNPVTVAQEHDAIVAALDTGDGEGAAALLVAHIQRLIEYLRRKSAAQQELQRAEAAMAR
jgi:DNA-binding GntR family transcriptional regulator